MLANLISDACENACRLNCFHAEVMRKDVLNFCLGCFEPRMCSYFLASWVYFSGIKFRVLKVVDIIRNRATCIKFKLCGCKKLSHTKLASRSKNDDSYIDWAFVSSANLDSTNVHRMVKLRLFLCSKQSSKNKGKDARVWPCGGNKMSESSLDYSKPRIAPTGVALTNGDAHDTNCSQHQNGGDTSYDNSSTTMVRKCMK